MIKNNTVLIIAAVLLTAVLFPGRLISQETKENGGKSAESGSTLYRVSRQYSFIRDPEVTMIIDEIGQKVARVFNASPERYHFYVINNKGVNAFTTPSGDIFLYSGQLNRLRSEDELAAVLAHEIAHREADHFAEIARKNTITAIPTIAAMILSKGEEAVVAGAIAVAGAYQLHFSREMEEEADLMALNALKKTVYDPLAIAGALEIIEKEDKLMPSEVPDHLSTHPPIEVRRAGLESILGKSLREVNWSPSPGRRWRRLRAIMAGITADPENLLSRWKSLDSYDLTADEYHYNGLTLMKAGHFGEAVFEMAKAIKMTPEDKELHADLGAAYFKVGDFESARRYLESARKEMPEYSCPFFYLAEIERETGKIQKAAVLYQKTVDNMPALPEAFYRYGLIMGEKGKNGEASYYLGVAALLDGKFPEALRLLKDAKQKLGGNLFWNDRIENRLSVFR